MFGKFRETILHLIGAHMHFMKCFICVCCVKIEVGLT